MRCHHCLIVVLIFVPFACAFSVELCDLPDIILEFRLRVWGSPIVLGWILCFWWMSLAGISSSLRALLLNYIAGPPNTIH